MEKGKLKKVILIYENTVSTLVGDQCESWLRDINQSPILNKFNWIEQDISETKFDKINKEYICPECLNALVVFEGCCVCRTCGYARSC
jgi:hypothetical protein